MLYIGPTWPNSIYIYIVANWDDDHNGRGVEPSKLWYRWPLFCWNNKKEPGEKKLGCLKTIRIPDFSQVEEDTVILHQASPSGFKWQNLVWFTLWWFEIVVESRHKSGKTSNYCWVIASIAMLDYQTVAKFRDHPNPIPLTKHPLRNHGLVK